MEVTNPRQLILDGKVAAIGEDGQEISAFDLYGVLIKSERQEFEEYLKVKKQQAIQEQLTRETEELQKQIEAQKKTLKTETPTQTPAATTTTEETFGQKMAKARADARAKREAEKEVSA